MSTPCYNVRTSDIVFIEKRGRSIVIVQGATLEKDTEVILTDGMTNLLCRVVVAFRPASTGTQTIDAKLVVSDSG